MANETVYVRIHVEEERDGGRNISVDGVPVDWSDRDVEASMRELAQSEDHKLATAARAVLSTGCFDLISKRDEAGNIVHRPCRLYQDGLR